jgi:hypothetical protein
VENLIRREIAAKAGHDGSSKSVPRQPNAMRRESLL